MCPECQTDLHSSFKKSDRFLLMLQCYSFWWSKTCSWVVQLTFFEILLGFTVKMKHRQVGSTRDHHEDSKKSKNIKSYAPPGNRTRGVRMGILHVTTTLAALKSSR